MAAWFTNSWRNRLRSNLDEQQNDSGPSETKQGRTGRLRAAVRAAGPLCRHPVPQLRAAVPGPADVRQDGAALAWRHAGGVEYLHGVFPGRAAGGLRVCSRGPGKVRLARAGAAAWGLAGAAF